jgi:hypothetical protein
MQLQSNATVSCSTECNLYPPVSITGSDIICTGSTGTTFSVAPPFGGVTGWTVSPDGRATFTTPTAGATSVTLVPASGASGIVTLTASLSNGCFSTTASRTVAVGEGSMLINDSKNTPTCAVPDATFAITTSYGAPSPYTWQVSAGTISSGQGTGQITVSNLPFQQYRLDVSVASPATCGGSTPIEGFYSQDYYTRNGLENCPQYLSRNAAAPTATLYPNPAKETVDVHVENADAAHPVTVRLFDGYGRARAEQTSTGAASVRLTTDKLPAGLYFVHILRGREVLSRQQLRIEK